MGVPTNYVSLCGLKKDLSQRNSCTAVDSRDIVGVDFVGVPTFGTDSDFQLVLFYLLVPL